MAKRINVSLPQADLDFCKSRDLSRSRLLQERISQIRDESNPSLLNDLKKLRADIKNRDAKVEAFSGMLQRYGEVLEEELGKEKFDQLLQKI